MSYVNRPDRIITTDGRIIVVRTSGLHLRAGCPRSNIFMESPLISRKCSFDPNEFRLLSVK
jgi:hypothetical protein